MLGDPKGAIPSYDALLLLGDKATRDAKLVATLRPLIGAIRVDDMRQANFMVDRANNKATPDVAAEWLSRAATR